MVSTRANTFEEAARALIEHSYAIVQLPKDVLKASDTILEEGPRFFDLKDDVKKAAASSSGVLDEGYLVFGAEKDKITGRPDLQETFKTWFRYAADPKIQSWAKNCKFHQVMSAGLDPYRGFVDNLFKALRTEIDPTYVVGEEFIFDIRGASYLQINFSRPAQHYRDTIMDSHEDGHLLTIIRPTEQGLMICPGSLVENPSAQNPVGVFKQDGELQPVDVQDGEVLLVPSSPTFHLTGGLVKPLFHAVASSDAKIRQSLMLFVNPTNEGKPIMPWIQTEQNKGVTDIHQVIDAVNYQHLERHEI
ncbi:MAG: hypothetical protein CL570_00315 [Alphaproteobacteria bacterium]|nr:hypothetical protein [Alphaproteobacteria bacterium]|tara:strand:+ start:13347 stop:14258 length:912 start_codon:yes stop_codon:yes gene_type:complete